MHPMLPPALGLAERLRAVARLVQIGLLQVTAKLLVVLGGNDQHDLVACSTYKRQRIKPA